MTVRHANEEVGVGARRQMSSSVEAAPRDAKRGKKKLITGTGKKLDPKKLMNAERQSVAAVKTRHFEGHRSAGRELEGRAHARDRAKEQLKSRPGTGGRNFGVVDESIRDNDFVQTEDGKLLENDHSHVDYTRTDPWRVMRITGEFVEGFDALAGVKRGISIFGSARTGSR